MLLHALNPYTSGANLQITKGIKHMRSLLTISSNLATMYYKLEHKVPVVTLMLTE